tara:strand:- start:291 stop:575 length:285 start_codon:yes stop_codon:yes gene_type:complete
MNRKQRRARDRQIKKSKAKTSEMEQKLGLFDLMPNECLVCHKSFDKTDKEQVMSWNVVVREQEQSVKIYCPSCWNSAIKILNEIGVSPDEGQTK